MSGLRLETRKERDERSTLRILAYLSEVAPRKVSERGTQWSATSCISTYSGAVNAARVLPQMEQAGLLTREGPGKPYFVTDEGRRYLEDARQRAMMLSPVQRMGWADEVRSDSHKSDSHKSIANFLRRLPEFRESDEARVQEVSRGLAEAMGLPAPQMPRSDVERSGR